MVNKSRDEIIEKLLDLEKKAAEFERAQNKEFESDANSCASFGSDNFEKKAESKGKKTFAIGIVWIGHTMDKGSHQEILNELGYPKNPEPAEIEVLSDQTLIQGRSWKDIKQQAMSDTFKFENWFVSTF